ncbi:MAG TPA: antibiotic biosynthesis monooxygenase [Candidatus Polarisedimenticolaceae bacterium]
MNHALTTVIIRYRTLPDRHEEAIRELSALVATVVAKESDCKGIRILQDASDPTMLLLDELWTSREAYLGPHLQTPHLLAFKAKAAQWFAGPPEISFWTLRAEPA